MRITVIFIIALLVVSNGIVGAQEHKNEITLTVGAGSFQDLNESFAHIGAVIFTGGLIRDQTETVIPVICINFKHHLNTLLSVGGTFNYQQFEREYFFLDEKVGNTDVNYYTFMGRVDFTYLRTSVFQMYSGLSAGFSTATESGTGVESDSEYGFAFQINAVGLRLGKEFAAVMELGFGYNAIIGVGLTYGF